MPVAGVRRHAPESGKDSGVHLLHLFFWTYAMIALIFDVKKWPEDA
jgi:hypothetical protein